MQDSEFLDKMASLPMVREDIRRNGYACWLIQGIWMRLFAVQIPEWAKRAGGVNRLVEGE